MYMARPVAVSFASSTNVSRVSVSRHAMACHLATSPVFVKAHKKNGRVCMPRQFASNQHFPMRSLSTKRIVNSTVRAQSQATETAVAEEKQAEAQSKGGYPFADIESKWQSYWEDNDTFRTPEKVDTSKPKYYALDMFPYPSGAGLHVGHPEGYTATDIMSRYKRMKGFNVLHPMGWDAFGLPAEQYAIETGTHPRDTTYKNVDRFRQQLKSIGFSYDWKREISTTDPKYYKWTQWIFQQLIKKDLAYQANIPVNWCPALGTVLANEEVIDGLSERGNHPVERRPMKQWMLRITAYADRLLDDLDEVDWPESVKDMQRNWIGKSVGASVDFAVEGGEPITVFTTRPDTLFGVTYMSVAPEHPQLMALTTDEQRAAVEEYVAAAGRKSDLERTELQKEKSGVWTGAYATNPVNGEKVPVWVADYVLGSYGSGAVMAVPAHDSRDHEFALKHGLPIKQVVAPSDGSEVDVQKEAFTEPGKNVNSADAERDLDLNGMTTKKAKKNIVYNLTKLGAGKEQVNYKLRDWLFARQRYWGEPFPIMFEEDAPEVPVLVPEDQLPVELPDTDNFKPTGDGSPPLAAIPDWVNVTSPNGKPAVRETNTMPQWAGSCWYYLRFIDPENDNYAIDPELEKYWMPVDLYVGGAEHSVLHLLYARFWHKVLYDCGVVTTKEPFQRLVNQGMILGEVEYTAGAAEDGSLVSVDTPGSTPVKVEKADVDATGATAVLKSDASIKLSGRAFKMSKSRGNVINPDDVITDFGADSLRLYEMFMGPLRETKVWSTRGVEGVHRFLARSYRLVQNSLADPAILDAEPTKEQLKQLHLMIQKVTTETDEMRFNTGISAMMEFVNSATKWGGAPKALLEPFTLLLSPYAPHIAEEFWATLGHSESLAGEPWPAVIEEYLVEDSIKMAVQVNGKVRATIELPVDADEELAVATAMKEANVLKYTDGMTIKKQIYRAGKILNLVVGK